MYQGLGSSHKAAGARGVRLLIRARGILLRSGKSKHEEGGESFRISDAVTDRGETRSRARQQKREER